jgi:hypothetical protein
MPSVLSVPRTKRVGGMTGELLRASNVDLTIINLSIFRLHHTYWTVKSLSSNHAGFLHGSCENAEAGGGSVTGNILLDRANRDWSFAVVG